MEIIRKVIAMNRRQRRLKLIASGKTIEEVNQIERAEEKLKERDNLPILNKTTTKEDN